MLTRKTPETLATEIIINGQGERIVLDIVYFNRRQADVQTLLTSEQNNVAMETDYQYANRQALLYIIKEWDSEYPLTDEGVKEMETDRPGMIEALFIGFHRARGVELVKN